MSIDKDLDELISNEIITTETANKINNYYKAKKGNNANKLFIVFGILGAILVGLGIILILAHNWDNLPRIVKTILAFIPLVIGQIICGFVLLKKNRNTTWIESSSVFLFFAVGASISLISQIYNIPGNIASFVLTWMLLCLPIVYLLKSSITSLLYIIGITFYGCKIGYWVYPRIESFNFWLLLAAILPYYYYLYRNKPKSNFMLFHNWLIPIAVLITLGTVANNNEEIMFISYLSLLGIFYQIGNSNVFQQQKFRNNSYLILGALVTIGLLLSLSFSWYWNDLQVHEFQFNELRDYSELISAILFFIISLVILIQQFKKELLVKSTFVEYVFIVFTLAFFIGLKFHFSSIIINCIIFIIGILTIKRGERKNHLGILNFGLIIITSLVISRFFDTDLSFIIRGLLFVSVGTGFFITNYWMLKKRKENEN